MPPVFGRHSPNPHPYDAELADWRNSGDVSYRAMARNVMHDHRVSEPRAAAFDSFGVPPGVPYTLSNRITWYFKANVRTVREPHFLMPTLNFSNIISGMPFASASIDPDYHLSRIIDLNGLAQVFVRARIQGRKHFQDFPLPPTDQDVSEWLTLRLEAKSTSEVANFLSSAFIAVNDAALHAAFQPSWVTSWDAFLPYLGEGASRWLQVLGISREIIFPHWLIVLKYTVDEAGTLIRPTILDAGWEAGCHFPSPPQAPLHSGGHPMDLRTTPRANTLLPEYLHEQIVHYMEHWYAAGCQCEKATGTTSGDLPNQRAAHHGLLATLYGPDVFAWMPECL